MRRQSGALISGNVWLTTVPISLTVHGLLIQEQADKQALHILTYQTLPCSFAQSIGMHKTDQLVHRKHSECLLVAFTAAHATGSGRGVLLQ